MSFRMSWLRSRIIASSGALSGALAVLLLLCAVQIHHVHDVRSALLPNWQAALCVTGEQHADETPRAPVGDHGIPECPACFVGKSAGSLHASAGATLEIAQWSPLAGSPSAPAGPGSDLRHNPAQARAPPETA